MVRLGIVGVGFGQSVHVPAFRSHPDCTIEAICASTAERARAVASRLGIPGYHGDWRELVADPGIDALAIATPPAVQALIVPAAAAAGKHVFCEKPLALDGPAASALAAAVEAAGVVGAVDFEFAELPSWQRARSIVRGGALGPLRQVCLTWRIEARAFRERLAGPPAAPGPGAASSPRTGGAVPDPGEPPWRGGGVSWKLDPAAGGGTLLTFVSHTFYYLEWLFGPVRTLTARLPAPGEARVDAWLEFDSGLAANVSVAADAFLGTGHRLEVYGEAGTLVLENATPDHLHGFVLALGTRPSGRLEPVVDERGPVSADGRIAAVGSLARRFVDGILAGRPVRPDLADAVRVQRLLDAARLSATCGGWKEP